MCISERIIKGWHCIDLELYVKPKARSTELKVENGELIFYSQEPPERGRVNESLIKHLSRKFGISPRHVEIIHGKKDRVKVVRICGITKDEALSSLTKCGE